MNAKNMTPKNRLFSNLRIRYKMFISFAAAFVATVTLCTAIIYITAAKSIEYRMDSELTNTSITILNMIQTTASVMIKGHLQTIAQQNYEIVVYFYNQYQKGLMSEQEARSNATSLLLSQTIGTTGYVYCLSSQGNILVHPNEELIHKNLSKHEFIRYQKKRKKGYIEYEWKNPGELKTRPKALYMTYFKPWDWIISASSYREEFHYLINMDDFRVSIRTLRFAQTGYAQVFDIKGNPMIEQSNATHIYNHYHPQYKAFVSTILQQKNGKRLFDIPRQNGQYTKCYVLFKEIPELGWIVACVMNLNEVYAPLSTMRYGMIMIICISLLLFLPITFWISSSITQPLHEFIHHLSEDKKADVSIRMNIHSTDEIGELARYFNSFMDRLEKATHQLKNEIKERQQAQEKIRLSERNYRELVQNSNSIILRIDPQGYVSFINQYAINFFCYSEDEMIGKRITDTIIPYGAPDKINLSNRLGHIASDIEQNMNNVLVNVKKTGEKVSILWTSKSIINDKGKIIEYLCIGNDMTARIKMEEVMVLTEKMKSIAGLAAGIAHEMNNPLGVIIQNTQNIIRRFSPEISANKASAEKSDIELYNVQQYIKERNIDVLLDDIRNAGTRAAEIIKLMLNFSRNDINHMRNVSLIDAVEKSISLASKDYELKKKYDFQDINIIKDYADNMPDVHCEPSEIQQVILNILKNAAHAVKKRPGDHTKPMIIIRLYHKENGIQLEITDNGPGMDENIYQKIFEPFFTTKKVGDGSGLGLSVSYFIIVNHHQGKIWVESSPGKGARFIVWLPITHH